MILHASTAVVSAGQAAPLGGHLLLVFLLQLGLLLGVAAAMGSLAARCRLPSVVGELAAGVLLGPTLLWHVLPRVSGWLLPADPAQSHLQDAVGQLGVLLLVGVAGMHLDLGLVRRRRLSVGCVGAGGLLVPLGLGVAAGLLLPASLRVAGTGRGVFACFIGVAVCVSAIPVIASTLLDMGLLHRDIGQLIVGAAAVDDIAGWLLLSLVSAVSVHSGHDGLLRPIGYLLGVLAVTVLIGRPVVRFTLRLASRSGTPGASIAAVVVLLLFCAAGTQALGLEPILGTFLGGVLIGSSCKLEREVLAPLRTFVLAVLSPLFFASSGLRMDLTALWSPAVLVAGLLLLLLAVLGKVVGVYLGARVSRLGHWEAMALGAGLNARGVVEVVVARVGLQLGILNTASYTLIVLIAMATSLMAPPMLRYAVGRIAETEPERERARRQFLIPAEAREPVPLGAQLSPAAAGDSNRRQQP